MTEANKALVRYFYEQLDLQNLDVYDEICTPDFKSNFPGSVRPQTIDERKATSRLFYDAFPNLKHDITDIIAEGETVAFRCVAHGTHQKEFMGFPPTNEQIEFTGMRFYRILGGKISEEWANFDSLGLWRKIGAKV